MHDAGYDAATASFQDARLSLPLLLLCQHPIADSPMDRWLASRCHPYFPLAPTHWVWSFGEKLKAKAATQQEKSNDSSRLSSAFLFVLALATCLSSNKGQMRGQSLRLEDDWANRWGSRETAWVIGGCRLHYPWGQARQVKAGRARAEQCRVHKWLFEVGRAAQLGLAWSWKGI